LFSGGGVGVDDEYLTLGKHVSRHDPDPIMSCSNDPRRPRAS
jgi:hypothetical protein